MTDTSLAHLREFQLSNRILVLSIFVLAFTVCQKLLFNEGEPVSSDWIFWSFVFLPAVATGTAAWAILSRGFCRRIIALSNETDAKPGTPGLQLARLYYAGSFGQIFGAWCVVACVVCGAATPSALPSALVLTLLLVCVFWLLLPQEKLEWWPELSASEPVRLLESILPKR